MFFFSRSVDNELQKLFYPIIEQNLVEFVDIYKNYFYSENIIFYQNAWKNNCYGSAYKRNMYSILKEFPTLIVDANILPDNTAKISASIWGFGSEREFSRKIFDCDCDKTKICSNVSYRRSIASQISAYLKFAIGYMYDLYNLVLYNRVPLLPRVASVEKDNNVSSALLNYDDIKKEISSTYSGIYSQILSIAGSNQSAEIKVLTDMNNTQLHQTRFDYAEAVKEYISAEQYLQCLDESIRAWTDLRTNKGTEEFLQELADNSKVEKYFSDDDRRYFIALCDAYYDAKQKSELGDICLKLSIFVDGKAAMRYYRETAEQGNAGSQFYLGCCYTFGCGVSKDYIEAIKWYRMAAEQGYAKAQFSLGRFYHCGLGVNKDEAEAVKWYREAAGQCNANAQCSLGFCYEYGNGVSKDYLKAVKWYRKAAEQGYAWAQFNLGLCYEHGNGVNKDKAEAVKWYRKAAEQSHAWAQCNLGRCYERGLGVNEDKAEAVKWYHKAAEQGYANAQYNLGCCYTFGRGVNKDYVEAVKWFHKAAEQGYANAQYNLGCCYTFGRGVNKDYVEAVKWYRKAVERGCVEAEAKVNAIEQELRDQKERQKTEREFAALYRAAERGDAESQFNLAESYYNGINVTQSRDNAIKWYRKAAEQGHLIAARKIGEVCGDTKFLYKLGERYYYGKGVSKDYTKAVKFYRKAAELGHSEAQFCLGNCYYCGRGINKDYAEAVKWYCKSAEQGYYKAQYNLGVCYTNGEGVSKDYTEAVKFYRKAAEQGHADAQYELGRCYDWGYGVSKDEAEAMKWYRKAADQGNSNAIESINRLNRSRNEYEYESRDEDEYESIYKYWAGLPDF